MSTSDEITFILNRYPTEIENKNLIGFELNYDELNIVIDVMQNGYPLEDITLYVTPYILQKNEFQNSIRYLSQLLESDNQIMSSKFREMKKSFHPFNEEDLKYFNNETFLLISYLTQTNPASLKFAFGDIISKEIRNTLMYLVKTRFFVENHLFILKYGPETDRFHIILNGMIPYKVDEKMCITFENKIKIM